MEKLTNFSMNIGTGKYSIDQTKAKSFGSKEEAIKQAKIDNGSEVIFEKDNKWNVAPIKEKTLTGSKDVSEKDLVKVNTEVSKMGLKNTTISFVEDKLPLNKADVLSSDDIKAIFNKGNYEDLKKLAENPSTPKEILKELASKSELIKVKVAGNINAPVEILKDLSKDSSKAVRGKVAENPNTPKEILKQLANDPTPFVRDKIK